MAQVRELTNRAGKLARLSRDADGEGAEHTWQELAQMADRKTTRNLLDYLHQAFQDKFNMYNFPVRADRIADDLEIPVEQVMASAEFLVSHGRAERIHRGKEPFPSYRLRRKGKGLLRRA